MSSDSEPPPSLIPPRDSLRPPQPTLPDFPPPSFMTRDDMMEEQPPHSLRIRSLPPMPEVAPIVEQANAARDRGEWDSAIELYKKALFVVPADELGTQASIYASVAEVKAAQEKPREAETNFEKALTINPKHMRSFQGLIRIATREKDWGRLAAVRRRRAEAFDDPDERATELCVVAEIEEVRLQSIEKALATLEIASIYRPDDVGILMKLRDFYLATRAWQKLIDTLDDLVRVTHDPKHRGNFRFQQADIALGRMREEPRGLAFLELTLDEDPQSDRALSALVAVRTRREEWAELSDVYERLIDRYAGLGDRDRAWEVCRKLGTLRRDRLLDGPGALEALTGALELRPDDAESRAALAELHAAKGERATAVRELETVSKHSPFRAQTYRRLFDLHQRAQRPDRAWLSATCLEVLGASDVMQDLMIEQYRPDGPIRPTSAVDESWWSTYLAADGADPIIEEILTTIGETAINLKLTELETKKALVILDPARRQERNSTASAVRTFVWSSRVLHIPLPDLYVLPDVPTGIAAIQARTSQSAMGPSALTGRTVQQLAFLTGRHLTYYRPAHYPLIFFPTLSELSSLVLSAVRLVIPGISVPPSSDGEVRIGDQLSQHLTEEQKAKLRGAVAKLDARGGKLDLLSWIRSVELTAARAGLLLAGDLRTVIRLMKDETRAIGELTHDEKRGDLIAFCASEPYGILREKMSVAIRPTAGSGNMTAAAIVRNMPGGGSSQ